MKIVWITLYTFFGILCILGVLMLWTVIVYWLRDNKIMKKVARLMRYYK